jgi:hypothetical protein
MEIPADINPPLSSTVSRLTSPAATAHDSTPDLPIAPATIDKLLALCIPKQVAETRGDRQWTLVTQQSAGQPAFGAVRSSACSSMVSYGRERRDRDHASRLPATRSADSAASGGWGFVQHDMDLTRPLGAMIS